MYANAQACPVLVQCRGTEGGVFVYTAVRELTCSSSSSSNICINTTASRILSQLVSQLVTFYSSCSFCCPVFLFVLPFCGYVCHLLGNWRQKLHCGRNQLCFKLIYTERGRGRALMQTRNVLMCVPKVCNQIIKLQKCCRAYEMHTPTDRQTRRRIQ